MTKLVVKKFQPWVEMLVEKKKKQHNKTMCWELDNYDY